MAAIPSTYLIEEAGDWDVPDLVPGRAYVVALSTGDPSTSEASVLFPIGPDGAFVGVDDNTFLATDPMSRRFVSPTGTMRISVTSYSGDIQVTVREITY